MLLQRNNRPVAVPTLIGREIRYSEVELSLYSEFSEEDYDSTNHTLNKESGAQAKNMFTPNIVHKMVKFWDTKVREMYRELGPFKIHSTDISK